MQLGSFIRRSTSAALAGYSAQQFRRDCVAGLTVATLALPLSMAFAIASGVAPEQGLFTSILCGAIVAVLGGSRVQIAGPTGAFVLITASTIQLYGLEALYLCVLMAGAMLCVMSLVRAGAVIRFIPYPVTRAFTKGIAVLILASQIVPFFGLPVENAPIQFVDRVAQFAAHAHEIHVPTLVASMAVLVLVGLWPARFARHVPGAMVGLVVATAAAALFGLNERFGIATIGSALGGFSSALPAFSLPPFDWPTFVTLIPSAFTIALLAAMQALLCASVTDGLIDRRHDSNRELFGQGIANLVGPLFGCIPATGAVARSVVNVRAGARTRVAALVHCLVLLVVLLSAAPLLPHVPLCALSAVLIVSAYRMVSWRQFLRLRLWPIADSAVFLATFGLTVLTTLTLAVEVGVVLAALLMVKRISETSQISAVDESSETEGPQHSLVGRRVPPGVLVFRVFGAFFFGVADKLDDELKRFEEEPQVLILRLRKVLAMDATGLQALEDLLTKLRAKGKHLVLSAPHAQPLAVMTNFGFIDRLGAQNVQPNIAAALARAREILGLPPETEEEGTPSKLRAQLEQARRRIHELESR